MKDALRWLPGIFAGLVWLLLTNLAQPWLSRLGFFLYTDAILLVIPGIFLPLRPALCIVFFCALFADATRVCPFGLSASILLPSLLVLHTFQKQLSRAPAWTWLILAVGLNAVISALFFLICWRTTAPTLTTLEMLRGMAYDTLVSSAYIAALAFWFFAFQFSLFKIVGKDLIADAKNKS